METTVLTPYMQEATDSLISNLVVSKAFLHYQNSIKRLNGDHHARLLLQKLSQHQDDVRRKQASGGIIAQGDIDTLRSLQEQVQNTPIIMDYIQSQGGAVAFLREINDEISQLTGLNFASFANHASC